MKFAQFILILLLAAGAGYLGARTASPQTAAPVETKKAESVYDRVMRTKTIRCAYAVYPPTLMKDPNTGELSGVFYDVIEKVGQMHDLEIVWAEEVDYGNILQGFSTGRYDMFCAAIWPGPERAQHALFSAPLYYSAVSVYVRTDDQRFDDDHMILNNPGYKISVQDGDINDSIAKADFPEAERVSIPQMAQSSMFLLNLVEQKADAAFAESSFAKDFMRNNPDSLRNITPDNPIRLFSNVYMIPKNEVQFQNMLNTVIQELTYRGYIRSVIEEHAGSDHGFYLTAKPFEVPE